MDTKFVRITFNLVFYIKLTDNEKGKGFEQWSRISKSLIDLIEIKLDLHGFIVFD